MFIRCSIWFRRGLQKLKRDYHGSQKRCHSVPRKFPKVLKDLTRRFEKYLQNSFNGGSHTFTVVQRVSEGLLICCCQCVEKCCKMFWTFDQEFTRFKKFFFHESKRVLYKKNGLKIDVLLGFH